MSLSLSLEVYISITQVCIGVSFTTGSFHFPFIASSGDPQDPHLVILAISVVLSGQCCVVSALNLPEITWQSNHVAPSVTSVSPDFWLSVEEVFGNDECWCKMAGRARLPSSLFQEQAQIVHDVVCILECWSQTAAIEQNCRKTWMKTSPNNKLDAETCVSSPCVGYCHCRVFCIFNKFCLRCIYSVCGSWLV